jgi:hypothetical protein
MSIILQDIMYSINIQHDCINLHCTNTAQQPVYQEQILTSCSRPIVQHKPTLHYFLNAYSIHNYDYIHLVTPNTLRETPLRVTNVAKVRTLAVWQMQEKQAAKKSGDVPQQGEGGHIDGVLAPHAVFDRTPTTVKTSAKAKAKVSSSSMQGRKKTAPSCTSQMVASPSGPASALPQSISDVAALDQQFPPQLLHHPLQPHLPAPQSCLPPLQSHVHMFPSAPITWHLGHQAFSHPLPMPPHFHHTLPPNIFPSAGPHPGPQPPQYHYPHLSSISPFSPAPYSTQGSAHP